MLQKVNMKSKCSFACPFPNDIVEYAFVIVGCYFLVVDTLYLLYFGKGNRNRIRNFDRIWIVILNHILGNGLRKDFH